MRQYTSTRVRGLAPWKPQAKTESLLEQVEAVLEEYVNLLPLTLRQLFYRLVGIHGYEKTEQAYGRLGETLNRARRAERIPFDAIRDDGGTKNAPSQFSSLPQLRAVWMHLALSYRRGRLEGQPRHLELWVEAGGMVPQVARVVGEYGITVYSSGGFDSTTVKYDAAGRMLERDVPTLVLHVGDFDPSGLSIFDSAGEDVAAFVEDLGGNELPEFHRVAVTEEQIATYGLPESPPKKTDRRGGWRGGTVQAEALAPDDLAAEVKRAVLGEIDQVARAELLTVEAEEREQAIEEASSL